LPNAKTDLLLVDWRFLQYSGVEFREYQTYTTYVVLTRIPREFENSCHLTITLRLQKVAIDQNTQINNVNPLAFRMPIIENSIFKWTVS
jgi:hypothetical protein